MHVHHTQRPEESAELPGTGYADGCEPPTVGTGAVSCRSISLALFIRLLCKPWDSLFVSWPECLPVLLLIENLCS